MSCQVKSKQGDKKAEAVLQGILGCQATSIDLEKRVKHCEYCVLTEVRRDDHDMTMIDHTLQMSIENEPEGFSEFIFKEDRYYSTKID